MTLSIATIEAATGLLSGRIRRTPLEASPRLSERLAGSAVMKLEHLQVTGSFKVRGAFVAMSALGERDKRAGIVTASAGNHGKAVAYVARILGVSATVYLPDSVDESKLRGIAALGAEIVRAPEPGYDETERRARDAAAGSGRTFLSAFDDDGVIAGNGGTLAAEVLADFPEARTFVLPVGGGGLSAGFALYAKERVPGCRIVGCQLESSPALAMSLERGEAVTTLPPVETAAGGLEGGIGRRTFEILRSRVDAVALCSEEEILEAVRWTFAEHQYVVEPSAAVVVAAALSGKLGSLVPPVVFVLSGRNVALPTLRRILA